MKARYLIATFSIMLVLGCNGVARITNGHVVSHIDGTQSRLTKEQLERLNGIIDRGTTRVLEQKWQVGNYAIATDFYGREIRIYSYSDRYFCVNNSSICHEVRPEYLDEFKSIFGSSQDKQ